MEVVFVAVVAICSPGVSHRSPPFVQRPIWLYPRARRRWSSIARRSAMRHRRCLRPYGHIPTGPDGYERAVMPVMQYGLIGTIDRPSCDLVRSKISLFETCIGSASSMMPASAALATVANRAAAGKPRYSRHLVARTRRPPPAPRVRLFTVRRIPLLPQPVRVLAASTTR